MRKEKSLPWRLEFSSLTSDQEKKVRKGKRERRKEKGTRRGESYKVCHPGDLNGVSGVNAYGAPAAHGSGSLLHTVELGGRGKTDSKQQASLSIQTPLPIYSTCSSGLLLDVAVSSCILPCSMLTFSVMT